jgi:alpha-beta hydrolase superfamily lysophospholipase
MTTRNTYQPSVNCGTTKEQKVAIKNSKGQHLAAVIHIPEEVSKQLVIICPGFLDTKDYKNHVHLAQALAQKGLAAVRFDPTGTWESEGGISEYNNTQYLDDIKSVLEFMLTQHRYTEVTIVGHSRGGMMSILYAARDQRITSVVAIMPSSGRSMSKAQKEVWRENGFEIFEQDIPGSRELKQFKVPYSQIEDRDRYNIFEDVVKIKAPILFLAGELDTAIPPNNVEDIFETAQDPKKYILIPGVEHDYRYYEDQIEKVTKVILEHM